MKQLNFVIFVAGLALSFLTITSCSNSNRSNKTQILKVQMGDVTNIIRDTQNTPQLDQEFFSKLKNKKIYLLTYVNFESVQTVLIGQTLSKNAVEKENAATKESEVKEGFYEFRVAMDTGKKSLQLTGDIKSVQVTFDFSLDSQPTPIRENLEILGVPYKGYAQVGRDKEVYNEHLLHFSRSADGQAFTLLTYSDEDKDSGAEITAYYFYTTDQMNYERLNPRYFFTFGEGVKVPWNKEKSLSVDICGDNIPLSARQEIQQSVDIWVEAINQKQKKQWTVSTREVPGVFLPFTDFKQHCVQVIDDFMSSPDPQRSGYGLTITVPNFHSGQIIDSDILVFAKEFKKQGADIRSPRSAKARNYTFRHEMGHFFGLDHQFTNGIESLMSYDFGPLRLSPYDQDAIQALYQ